MIEFEKGFSAFEMKERNADVAKIEQSGVEIIRLSPQASNWFVDAAREGAWKHAQKRFPGDVIPKLRERITK